MLGASHWLMIAGAGLVLLGMLLRRWAARYDLKEAAIESAWTLLRGRRTAANPTAIEAKLREIGAQSTWTGKAGETARTAVGHAVAQVAQATALVTILVGLTFIAAGYIWR
jgi:hypothetical protein